MTEAIITGYLSFSLVLLRIYLQETKRKTNSNKKAENQTKY